MSELDMGMDPEIQQRLRAIEEKLEVLIQTIKDLQSLRGDKPRIRRKKEKLPPPTAEEIARDRNRFSNLYERWMNGFEVEVHNNLDGMEPDELRRFADANNLNVTSRMSKNRILELIAARFREKRQLQKSTISRAGQGD